MIKVAILGAGPEQVEVIQVAKQMGYKVYALDSNSSASGKRYADVFFQCNINSVNEVVRIAKKINIDGIMLHAIDLPHIAYKASNQLNLPGLKSSSAANATNKLKRIEILTKNKIPSAKFGSSKNMLEAKRIAKDIGYPVVIKPLDNAGSRGVLLVENEKKMENYFSESIKFCKNKKEVLVEEYLSGIQISTETIINNGKMFTTGFSDRNYSDSKKFFPYFIEDGGDMPSILPPPLKKETIKIVEKAIKALGIDFGPAKGDIVIHNNEPHIIEMAPRTSGGRFASFQVPASTGVNILRILLKMAVGEKVTDNEFQPKFSFGSSQRYVIPKPGKIFSITGLEKARKIKGVYAIITAEDLQVGSVVPPITDNSMKCKKILVLSKGKTREVAKKSAIIARDLIKIETKPI